MNHDQYEQVQYAIGIAEHEGRINVGEEKSLLEVLEADARELETLRAIVSQAISPRTVRGVADSSGDNWSQPLMALREDDRVTRADRRKVRYVPAEQQTGWVPAPGERVAYAPNTAERGTVNRVLTVVYVDWDEGHCGSHEPCVLAPLPPPPVDSEEKSE